MIRLACVCPTYGRPRAMIENAVACFTSQDYPSSLRKLIILDDAGLIAPQTDAGLVNPRHQLAACTEADVSWAVLSTDKRWPSLPAKFNALMGLVSGWADAVVVWEDDDVYLPWHLTAHARALEGSPWSHPSEVWSTYAGLGKEPAAGRFHASLAIRAKTLWSIGGWLGVMPPGDEKRGDFDQRLIQRLHGISPPGDPNLHRGPSYVYRWGDSGGSHGSATMRSPSDSSWYDSFEVQNRERLGRLTPAFDPVTQEIRRKIVG